MASEPDYITDEAQLLHGIKVVLEAILEALRHHHRKAARG